MRALSISVLALAAAACGPGAPKTGTAKFRFQVADNAKMSSSLTDPLMGTIYGNVFLVEDVSITGPRSDAMEFQFVEVAGVDVRTGVSAKDFVTKELEPGKYVFLGFFDVDGNGATMKNPDTGDPVTLPRTNEFEITAGAQVDRLVLFELIYNN